ncbi:hypothetical protein CPB84DRAFT_1845034 [Gymnopilus junonius]|uniref:Uncharacterized protein n=1 Tax=Gymnopilus junonius TaxID=109634 RepID=A0A9P5NUN9_GYMJU|nr:hypothetical protein CPB84DRAFT_1845034 [Gymnopilus junonius]
MFEKTQGQRWIYVNVAGNKELNKKIYMYFTSPYTAGLLAAISLGVTNLSPSSSQGSTMEWSMKTLSDLSSSSSSSSLSFPSSDPTILSNTPSTPTSPFPPKLEQFFMPKWLSIHKHQLPTHTILAWQNQAWKELM